MVWSSIRNRSTFTLGLALGIAAGRIGYPAAMLTRMMIASTRQPFWRKPADVGLYAEDVVFPSDDGVTLRGWFIHRVEDDGTPAPVVIFVHGWPWNRVGNLAGQSLLPDRNVDFLVPAQALSQAGFHVLLFDLRNHGQSDAAWPVTFGIHEARDFVGAVAMLRKRPDVDRRRIGAIGYSMGGNTLIYVGAPPLAQVAPAHAAPHLGETRMLYIQGSGDTWGSLADAQAIADATPNALPLVVAPSTERFGGYMYVNQHLDEIVKFFEEGLG
jgi:uncharacterized protein